MFRPRVALLNESAIICVGQIATALTGVATLCLLTRLLSPAQLGYLTLALTISSLLYQFAFAPIASTLSRLLMESIEHDDAHELRAVFGQIFFRHTRLSFLVVFPLAIGTWLLFGSFPALNLILAAMAGVLSGGAALVESTLIAARRQQRAAIWQFVHPLLRYGCGLYAAFCFESAGAVLGGYVVGTFLALCVSPLLAPPELTSIFAPRACTLAPSEFTDRFLTYMRPFQRWSLSSWAQASSDRWSLNLFSGAEAVGHYSVNYQFGYYPLVLLTAVFEQGMIPRLFRTKRIPKNVVLYSALAPLGAGVAACVIWIFVADRVSSLLLSERYPLEVCTLIALSLAGGCYGAGQLLSLHILRSSGSHALAPIKIGSALLGSLANGLGAAAFGTLGASLGVLFHGVLYLGWTFFECARVPEWPPEETLTTNGK